MRRDHLRQNSNDEFHVYFSKWKVWVYTIFCWFIACIPLAVIILLVTALFTRDDGYLLNIMIVLALCAIIFLLFAAIPFLFLTKLNKPVVTLTRREFSGLKFWKLQSFVWTPSTVMYFVKSNVVLANLDANQSRSSKLWAGPKESVSIPVSFAKQNHSEILEAINKLSPYPVKQTTIWGAAK